MSLITNIAVFETIAELKAYDGTASVAVVQETNHQGVYFNIEGATADEVTIYDGVDDRMWQRTLVPEIDEALNANQGVWGTFTGTLSDQADLQDALDDKIGANNPTTTGTAKHGDGGTTTIPNGAGTATAPNSLVSVAGDIAAIGVYANDGTNNRRIGLFVDNTNSLFGISTTQGGTSAPFVFRNSGGERLRINTNGTIKLNAYTTEGYLFNNTSGDISTATSIPKSIVGLSNVDNTSDANKPVSTAQQTEIDTKQDALISGTSIKTINSISLLGSGDIPISLPTRVFIGSDVANSTTSFANITSLQFPVVAGEKYEFKFFIVYNSAATTTGAAFSINGPTLTSTNYISSASLSTTSVFRNVRAGYDLGTETSNSILTNNIALIEGVIQCSASGNVVARFKSGVAASAITVKAGNTYVSYSKIN